MSLNSGAEQLPRDIIFSDNDEHVSLRLPLDPAKRELITQAIEHPDIGPSQLNQYFSAEEIEAYYSDPNAIKGVN